MLDYLEKFKKIPDDIRLKISNPKTVENIKELDEKYQLDMGSLVIRLMIRDLKFNDLIDYLVNDLNIPKNKAEELKHDLKANVFPELLEYLEVQPTKINNTPNTPTPSISSIPNISKTPNTPPEVVLNLKQEIKNIEPVEVVDETEAKIEKVIKKTNINFSSQIMETRFRQILRIYLRGVRNRINTKATIMKSFDLGGLGLDEKSVENIFSMLNEENKPGQTKIKQPARIKVPEDRKDFAKRDTEYNLAAAVKDKPILEKTEESALSVLPEKIAPPSPGIIIKMPEQAKSNQPIIKPAPNRNPITKVERTGSGKIKMDDIRSIPRVLSPVDELRYMTMVNFRNLNPDPSRRTEIILEKIELFREEEYAKKIAGINAWKLSPVNQAYINILKSSISNGQPINAVLAEQLKQNPNFMTQDEFNAIVKLNKQLSY